MKSSSKIFIQTGLLILGICIALVTPLMEKEVTIDKSQIYSNKPFAGLINDEYVGTDLCVNYWLSVDQQPEIGTYHIRYSILEYVLGSTPSRVYLTTQKVNRPELMHKSWFELHRRDVAGL